MILQRTEGEGRGKGYARQRMKLQHAWAKATGLPGAVGRSREQVVGWWWSRGTSLDDLKRRYDYPGADRYPQQQQQQQQPRLRHVASLSPTGFPGISLSLSLSFYLSSEAEKRFHRYRFRTLVPKKRSTKQVHLCESGRGDGQKEGKTSSFRLDENEVVMFRGLDRRIPRSPLCVV